MKPTEAEIRLAFNSIYTAGALSVADKEKTEKEIQEKKENDFLFFKKFLSLYE